MVATFESDLSYSPSLESYVPKWSQRAHSCHFRWCYIRSLGPTLCSAQPGFAPWPSEIREVILGRGNEVWIQKALELQAREGGEILSILAGATLTFD